MRYVPVVVALAALAGCKPSENASGSRTAPASATPPTVTSAAVLVETAPVAAPANTPTAATTPSCTAPSRILYLEEHKPICGRPCKVDPDCPEGEACNLTALKNAEGIGTARDAVPICGPKKTAGQDDDRLLPRVAKGTSVLDTSDWKTATPGSTLALRWSIDQRKAEPPVKPGSDLTKHKVPLELTMTVAGRAHTVTVETDAAPPYSDKCSQVSFFYAGLNLLFQVKRAEGGRAILTRTETSESASRKMAQLYAFDLPARLKVTQEIVTITPDGKQTSKTCSADDLGR